MIEKFAFALSPDNFIEKKHFGDSDKFSIYEWDGNSFQFVKDVPNMFKSLEENNKHGSKEKGLAIIDFFKNEGVGILVSNQFGKNIKIINQSFLPVIVGELSIVDALLIIAENFNKLKQSYQKNSPENKLLDLR